MLPRPKRKTSRNPDGCESRRCRAACLVAALRALSRGFPSVPRLYTEVDGASRLVGTQLGRLERRSWFDSGPIQFADTSRPSFGPEQNRMRAPTRCLLADDAFCLTSNTHQSPETPKCGESTAQLSDGIGHDQFLRCSGSEPEVSEAPLQTPHALGFTCPACAWHRSAAIPIERLRRLNAVNASLDARQAFLRDQPLESAQRHRAGGPELDSKPAPPAQSAS